MLNRGRKAIRDGHVLFPRGTSSSKECDVQNCDGRRTCWVRLLIKMKGHLCILTNNYLIPDRATAQRTVVTFHVHTADPASSCTPARRRILRHNAFSYLVDEKHTVSLDPACYFVTSIILDFTCISISVPSQLDSHLVQPVPRPRVWDQKPNVLRSKLLSLKGKSKKKNDAEKKLERPSPKYNFVITKKKNIKAVTDTAAEPA